ncbi:MAG TPA: glycosyltransferase family 39 protein [Acetobacteraceae bacterium]|nr:glycosyltransferase family 39 protein [Acetobacteraceae bacterium]
MTLLRQPGLILALLGLAIHLYANSGYGIFRDELYFIVCGEHPAWGYVDQPPLIPLAAALMHHLFPRSLAMLRLLPALGHAATIALTAETVRVLGGRRWAQALAALCVLTGIDFLGAGTLLTTDAVQSLAWLFCAYALIRITRDRNEWWWIAIGAVAGVALLTKYMLAFWLVALGIGLLATPARRSLARPQFYAGATLGLMIVLPNVIWQAMHGFPFLEIGRVAAAGKNVALPPLVFLHKEIDELNTMTAPVWIAGLLAFARWPRFAAYRGFAIAFVVLFAAMIAMHAKPYYPMGAYPLFLAGGAVALEAWIAVRVVRAALPAAIAMWGALGVPFVVPLLPVEQFAAYQTRLGITQASSDRSPLGVLQQNYADMFGWPELAALVGRAYQSLPPDEQARAVFLGENYGEAAAVDVLSVPRGKPPVISGHNTYYLWGPLGHDGRVVIRLGGNRDAMLRVYASVEKVGVLESPWAMPTERGKTLWICRGRRRPLQDDWPRFRHYD